MSVIQVCHKCNLDFKSVIKTNDYCLKSFSKICSKCQFLIETAHDPDTKLNNNDLKLPNQSLFFHLNAELLYNQNDISKFIYKNVLVVGTREISRRKRIKQLKSMSFKKFVCLNNQKNWALELFDDWIEAEHWDVSKKEETLKAVIEYQERHGIKFDSIFTYDCNFVLITSYLTTQLNLLGIPFELIKTLKYKNQFRKRCSELNIACPKFFLIESSNRMFFIEKMKSSSIDCKFIESQDNQRCMFPIILKNNFGLGKDFIRKCRDCNDVLIALQQSLELNIDILVEEFVTGNEIDIDILIQDSEVKFMAITDNFPPQEPFFYEQGCITPSIKLSSHEKILIETLIKKWIKLLQIQNGCLHFEAICVQKSDDVVNEDNFLMPIEINPRMGGAETWSMIKAAYDVDLLREHMKISLGIKLELDVNCKQAKNQCISWDFRENFDMYLESIRINLCEIIKDEDIVEVAITHSPGDTLYRDYYGFLTVKTSLNSSEIEMRKRLLEVLSFIKFSMKNINNNI